MTSLPERVEVLDPVDRWLHLAVAIGVVGAFVTGPALESPALAEAWSLDPGAMGRLHGGLAGLGLLAWALHLVRVCLAWLEGRNPTGLLLRSSDVQAGFRALRRQLGLGGDRPCWGRFSYRERVPYTAFLVAFPVLGLTGWLEGHPQAAVAVLGGRGLMGTASVHAAAAALLVPLLVWHLYFAHLQPGVLFWNGVWLTGHSTWDRVERLRPGWAAQLRGNDAPMEDTEVESEPPSVEALLEAGNEAARDGRYAEAETALVEALRLYPGYSQALFNLGVVRRRRGDAVGAAEALERFLEQDPFSPVAPKARELLRELREGDRG